MFAGSLSVKKRAFKPPSLKPKDEVQSDAVESTETLRSPAPPVPLPMAKRRRLLACPAISTKDVRRPDAKDPEAAAGESTEEGEALPGWCPGVLDDEPWFLEKDAPSVSACHSSGRGLHQLQSPKSFSMAAQPLVNMNAVRALQAHLVPQQLKDMLPVQICTKHSHLRNEVDRPSVRSVSGGRTVAMVNPPAHFGKPRIAGKGQRQTKMEDFNFISGACPGAEQQCSKPMHAMSSTVSDIRHDKGLSSESDLTAAITEQLILQQDELKVIWKSPEKQLQEMMKAPALPFTSSLDMDFLKAILG